MSFSDYLENELLDHVFGGADFTRPATVYIALSTTTPADDGSNFTEPSGNNYSRPAVTNNVTNFPAASGGSKSNGTEIAFPQASGSWGTVTHFAVFDAISGGNQLGSGALTTPKAVGANDTPKFPIGSLTITLD